MEKRKAACCLVNIDEFYFELYIRNTDPSL